jgi:hypothetical protein
MAEDQDIVSARNTFASFVTLMKWATIAFLSIGAIIVLLIAPGK